MTGSGRMVDGILHIGGWTDIGRGLDAFVFVDIDLQNNKWTSD